jgi:very-short-patch-repair endonuclease
VWGGILPCMADLDDGEYPKSESLGVDPGIERLSDVGSTKSPPVQRIWEVEQPRGTGDAEVRRIASRQCGVILREQLLGAGIGRGAIEKRLAKGSLAVMHRGVYAVGHDALAPHAHEMAALLRYRGHAVLSHRTAGAVWRLLPQPYRHVDLTVVGIDARSSANLSIRQTRVLHRRDFRWRQGLPVTAPARTMIDLAGCLDDDLEVERALAELRVRGLARDAEIRAAMERTRTRSGVARLRALMASEYGPALTRSEAEKLMRRSCDQAGLPRPSVNARVCGFEVDFLWPVAKLIVEVDGGRFHRHPMAFERDRRRDQVLVAAGYRVIRVTWRQLTEEAMAVMVRIGQALAISAASAG